MKESKRRSEGEGRGHKGRVQSPMYLSLIRNFTLTGTRKSHEGDLRMLKTQVTILGLQVAIGCLNLT